MKNLILIALLFASRACFAQKNTDGLLIVPKNSTTSFYSSSVTRTLPFTQQNYLSAKQWIANNLIIAGATRNKDNTIAGTASFTVASHDKTHRYPFTTKFQVDLKERKYSIRFYDVALKDQNTTISERQLIMKGSKTIPVGKAHIVVKNMGTELDKVMESFRSSIH